MTKQEIMKMDLETLKYVNKKLDLRSRYSEGWNPWGNLAKQQELIKERINNLKRGE